MIGEGIGLARDIFAEIRAKKQAAIETHNRVAAAQRAGTFSETLLASAQLYSFKAENLLREEAFWFVAIPILISSVFPNFMHQCVQNVTYAIPEKMLWVMGGMIGAIFGFGKIKDWFK